ncbi:MAG: hypothetical protein Q8R40_06585 [bacterium]|nr:hypothetical protein [bacterium]
MAKIEIDYTQCRDVVARIKSLGGVPPDREDPMPLSFPSSVAENAWCAIVAINHQTTPVVGTPLRGYVNGKLLRGWDYLLQKAIEQANRISEAFTTPWLSRITPEELFEFFYDSQEQVSLNRIEERAFLLNDLGNFLVRNGWESIRSLYERSEGYIERQDGHGIAQSMSEIKAYADPVKKKLFYFFALMRNQGFWTYRDIEHFGSPVNYHEQRGHFRIGTVRILDERLKQKIAQKENITFDEDIEIRLTVRGAIHFMAQGLGVSPSEAHYFFWNFFRNCCARDTVHCSDCPSSCKLPSRYRIAQERQCVFAPVCKSAYVPVSDMLIEPRLDDTIWQ